MLPYILAAVGGYLIGQSQKKDVPQMAKGGMTDLEKYHNENGPYITEMELDEYFEKSVDGYKKEDFFNVAENMGYEYDEDSDQYIKMAKGWKTKDYMLYEYIVTTKIVDEQGSNKEIDSWVYANDEKSAIEKAEKNIKKDNPKVEIKESSVSEVEDDGEYAKGGKIPEKEVESLKRYTLKWYGKDGLDDDDDADFKPPVTQKEVEDAVSEYVRFCKKAMSEGNESKWGGGDSFDREVVADIMQYNRNPEADTFFYPELIKEIKNIDGKMPMMYAKGGKTKSKKWIQDALGGDEGSLRRTAKRKGLLKGDENLSMTDLKKLQKMGGKTAKRAHLAETLRKFDDGGTMN